MAYAPISPYVPSPKPIFTDSQEKWIEEELRKLERTIAVLKAAIEELQAKVP
jgi:hypothetical protein